MTRQRVNAERPSYPRKSSGNLKDAIYKRVHDVHYDSTVEQAEVIAKDWVVLPAQ